MAMVREGSPEGRTEEVKLRGIGFVVSCRLLGVNNLPMGNGLFPFSCFVYSRPDLFSPTVERCSYKNSPGDEIANVNFLRRYRSRTSKKQKSELTSFNKLDDSLASTAH